MNWYTQTRKIGQTTGYLFGRFPITREMFDLQMAKISTQAENKGFSAVVLMPSKDKFLMWGIKAGHYVPESAYSNIVSRYETTKKREMCHGFEINGKYEKFIKPGPISEILQGVLRSHFLSIPNDSIVKETPIGWRICDGFWEYDLTNCETTIAVNKRKVATSELEFFIMSAIFDGHNLDSIFDVFPRAVAVDKAYWIKAELGKELEKDKKTPTRNTFMEQNPIKEWRNAYGV